MWIWIVAEGVVNITGALAQSDIFEMAEAAEIVRRLSQPQLPMVPLLPSYGFINIDLVII